MKIQWLFIIILAPAWVTGQQKDVQPDFVPSLPFHKYLNLTSPSSVGLLPQAKFSHKTPKGSIYTLPIDNMPCLVPDMGYTKRMPNTKPGKPSPYMPNVYPKYYVIPKEKQK